MNNDLEYKLGQIDAKLDENDRAHGLILASLGKIECAITNIEKESKTSAVDVAGVKASATASARLWAIIMSLISSLVVTLIAWAMRK